MTVLENEANNFAQNTLLPESEYLEFINAGIFSEGHIREFANIVGIHPGIIVGRLQVEKHIGFDRLNRLKEKYIIQ